MAETFGKYEILRKLGAGGMAEVFLVRSLGAAGVEKRLVVKRILPDFAKSSKFNAMFIDEARIAVSLNHPNIVQVYDFGRQDGHYYLAMEFVDGPDLAHLVADALSVDLRPPPGVCAFIIGELLKGLDYAHRKRDPDGAPLHIVHRDVSPQNVVIGAEGGVKITDFGIARARTAAPEDAGTVKGKMAYMAPEQARGGVVDGRADLYAVGILLWELLCGRGLFTGASGLASPPEGPDSPPPPTARAVDPTIPQGLSDICDTALSFDPDQRYDDARSMSSELAHWLMATGELHDSFTLSEFLAQVRQALEETSGEEGPAATMRLTNPTLTVSAEESRVRTVPNLAPITLPTPPERPTRGRARRTVTVRRDVLCVCGEIDGFTELRRQVSEELFRQDLMAYLAMLEAIAFKASAVTRRVSEGGFTMLVGLPLSSETDGAQAVALAQAVLEATDGVNRNLQSPLTVSLGIYRGGCSVTRTSGERQFDHELDAGVDDLARRLAREAQPAEVLASGGAWRAARREFRFEEVPSILVPDLEDVVSGTAGRLKAYSLVGPKDRAERARDTRAARGRLHGRELELRTLGAAFGRVALEGKGGITALVGEAGIGKTALVEAFVGGHAAEARVLRAEAGRLEAPPYSLVADLLSDLLELDDGDGPRDLKRKLETWFRAHSETLRPHEARYLLHSLGAVLKLKYRDSVVEGLDPQARRARTFLSLRRVLELMALDMPLVVVFDGLERMDRTSRDFLAELVDEGAPGGVHVLLVGRAGGEGDALFASDGVEVLRPDDLSERARQAMVRDWLGERPDAEAIAASVTRRAGGNPLFLLEVLETLEEQSLLDTAAKGGTLPMPRSIEGLLAARIDALHDDDRSLLVRVAQVDRPLTSGLIAALCPELEGPEQALGRLADLGIVVREPGATAWRFRRPLLREVAAAALPEDDRPMVHGRAAAWLEELVADGQAVDAGEIARHHLRAGEKAEAAIHLLRLGQQAFDAGSADSAVEALGKAVELMTDDSPDRLLATDLLERAWGRSGRPEGRQDAVAAYRAAAKRAGDAGARCSGLLRQGTLHRDRMELDQATTVLEQGLALARSQGVRAEEGRALAALGQVAAARGDSAGAQELCEQALSIFEGEGLREDQAITLNTLGIATRRAGDAQAAVRHFRRSLKAQRPGADETTREATLSHLALALEDQGEHEEALSVGLAALKLNREIGNRRRTGLILGHLSQIYLELGDSETAYHRARQSVRHCRERRNPLHEGLALVSLARVELERERTEQARAALLYASAVAQDTHAPQLDLELCLAQAHLALMLGDPADALDHAERAAASATETAQPAFEALARARMALAMHALDRPEDALDTAREALRLLPDQAPTTEVEVCLSLAQVAAASDSELALARAAASVRSRADRITDPKLRALFEQRPMHERATAPPQPAP